jgi:hypothetical protein
VAAVRNRGADGRSLVLEGCRLTQGCEARTPNRLVLWSLAIGVCLGSGVWELVIPAVVS